MDLLGAYQLYQKEFHLELVWKTFGIIFDIFQDDTIDILFNNIVLDDDDICFKYICCMYNIFETLDKTYIQKYDKRLNDFKNSKICKKNKFKIMDILEMV